MDLFWPGFEGEPLSDKIDAANQIKTEGSNSLAIARLRLITHLWTLSTRC
jgi:hypothetical protein